MTHTLTLAELVAHTHSHAHHPPSGQWLVYTTSGGTVGSSAGTVVSALTNDSTDATSTGGGAAFPLSPVRGVNWYIRSL